MKLIIIASLIACSFAAKLDRTYLPPPGAQSSGGSPGSLETPFGSAGSSGFGQTPSFGVNQGLQGQTQGGNQPAFGTNQGFKAQGGNQFGAAGQGFEQSASDTPEGFDQNFGPQDNFSPEQGFGAESQRPERPQAESDRTAEILRDTNENDGETFSYSFETSNGISAEESGVATNGVQAQGAFAYTGDDGQMYSVTYTADENGYLPRGDHLPTPPPIPDEILRSLEKNAQAAIAGTQEGAYNPEEDVATPQQYNAQNSPQQSAGQSQQYGVPASPFDAPVSNQEAQMNYNAGTNGAAAAKFAPKGDAPARFAPSAPAASSGFVPSAPTGPDSTRFAPSRPAQSGFAPSAPSTFTPSRPSQGPMNFASASAAQQYNRPTPNFRQQNNIPVQAQDESGYQYNQPQNGGSQVFRAATSSFGASPSSNAGPQGSFARPTSGRPETPAFIAQPARPAAPISNNGFQAQRPSVPISNNAQSVRYNAGGNFQRPSAPVSNNAQYNGVGNGFQASRPTPVSKNVQPTHYNAGSTVQRPSNNVQPSQYNAASNYQSSRIPEYQSAPYQYNPPRPQGQQRPQQNGNQGSGPFNSLATQTFNQGGQIQGPQNQGSQKQVRPSGQDFSGPLQQPSFSPEEGYKY